MKQTEVQTRFSENLKRLRKERKLTQFQLAEKAGVSEAMIKAVELSTSWPSEKTITQISEALNVDVVQFFLPVSSSFEINKEIKEKINFSLQECFKTFISETLNSLNIQ